MHAVYAITKSVNNYVTDFTTLLKNDWYQILCSHLVGK